MLTTQSIESDCVPDDDYFEQLKQRFGLATDKTRDDLRSELAEAPVEPLSVDKILREEPDKLKVHLLDVFEGLNLSSEEREEVTHLRRIVKVHSLADAEIEWLALVIQRRAGPRYLFAVLARFWQERSSIKRDVGYLARASRCWRDAKQPEQALSCLKGSEKGAAQKLLAIIHTCRAAALKDMLHLLAAEDEANRALRLNDEDPHPFNVLGAVFYLKRDFKTGDDYYKRAEERGSFGGPTRGELEQVLESMSGEDKHALARHLLGVDSKKYAWVAKAIRL